MKIIHQKLGQHLAQNVLMILDSQTFHYKLANSDVEVIPNQAWWREYSMLFFNWTETFHLEFSAFVVPSSGLGTGAKCQRRWSVRRWVASSVFKPFYLSIYNTCCRTCLINTYVHRNVKHIRHNCWTNTCIHLTFDAGPKKISWNYGVHIYELYVIIILVVA